MYPLRLLELFCGKLNYVNSIIYKCPIDNESIQKVVFCTILLSEVYMYQCNAVRNQERATKLIECYVTLMVHAELNRFALYSKLNV